MAQSKKVEETKEAPKEWDRKCQKCGSTCLMENPEVYDIEVYECQNQSCRAQYTIQAFYDLKTGKYLKEEFKGMTMGPING